MEDGKLEDLELKLVYFSHISFKQKQSHTIETRKHQGTKHITDKSGMKKAT